MIRDTQLESWVQTQRTRGRVQQAYLECIAARGGATCWEVAQVFHVHMNSVSGRLTELTNEGVIHDSGQRKPNPQTGKKGIVWTTEKIFKPEQATDGRGLD